MSLINLPPKPVGNSPFHVFCIRVYEELFERGRLVDSPDIMIEQSSRGRSLKFATGSDKPTTPAVMDLCYAVIKMQPECLICRTWDGNNLGPTDILIAKMPEMRQSFATETLNGVLVVYSDWNWDNQTRIAKPSDTNQEETQIIVPLYREATKDDQGNIVGIQSLIWPKKVNYTGIGSVYLIDSNVSGRYWCKKHDQP